MYRFTFTTLAREHSKRVERVTRCRTNDPDRAVRKIWGARAFWWPDSGVSGYGQVMEKGGRGITDRVRLDVVGY